MTALVVTKENFINLIPQMYSMLDESTECTIISNNNLGKKHIQGLDTYYNKPRVDMKDQSLESDEEFLQFIQSNV